MNSGIIAPGGDVCSRRYKMFDALWSLLVWRWRFVWALIFSAIAFIIVGLILGATEHSLGIDLGSWLLYIAAVPGVIIFYFLLFRPAIKEMTGRKRE
jgi:hypothetical protein